MSSRDELIREFDRIKTKATYFAGELDDLCQRAKIYHRLYRHSNGNYVFPLIAAHGALWAVNYFQFAIRCGRTLARLHFLNHSKQQRYITGLDEFADEFREINRQVCIDTYTWYHFVDQYQDAVGIAEVVPERLLAALKKCHQARRSGRQLSLADRREVFDAFFMNEQESIVRPIVDRATENFDWRFMKFIALRPRIRFAFFKRPFWFRNFANTDERIERGKLAFNAAARVGFERAEHALMEYGLMPDNFLDIACDEFLLDQFGGRLEKALAA